MMRSHYNICLAGTPGSGKNTLFNRLVGCIRPLGCRRAVFRHRDHKFSIMNLPAVNALTGAENDAATVRNRICFGKCDAVIVVCGPVDLLQGLELLFTVREYRQKVVFVINMIDVALKHKIILNRPGLMLALGVPVVFTSTKTRMGIAQLKDAVLGVVTGARKCAKRSIYYPRLSEEMLAIMRKLEGIPRKEIIAARILDGDEEFFRELKKRIDCRTVTRIDTIRSRHEARSENHDLIRSRNRAYAEIILKDNVHYPDAGKTERAIERPGLSYSR